MLLGLARIRTYAKEPSTIEHFFKAVSSVFFPPRCVFVGALARKYTNVQKTFPVDANFARVGSHLRDEIAR